MVSGGPILNGKFRRRDIGSGTTTLKTIAAGGPYTIQLPGSSKEELKKVMMGEVWIEKKRIENDFELNNAKMKDKFDWWLNDPGILHNSMINPVVPDGIAGEDRNFVRDTAKIDGKTIFLSSKEIKAPVAAGFCFDDTSMPDVFSAEGLPLAPFRTDKWE